MEAEVLAADAAAKAERRKRIVLDALTAATLARGGVVRVSEVLKHITPPERTLFPGEPRTFSTQVSAALRRSCELGEAVSPGIRGRHRMYAAAGVELGEPTQQGDEEKYYCDTVLEIVRIAVERVGRPVRVQDVAHEMDRTGIVYDRPKLRKTLVGLVGAGRLKQCGRVRAAAGGRVLYLPAEVNPDHFEQGMELSFTDQVARTFERMWSERVAEAGNSACKPLPFTVSEFADLLAQEIGEDATPAFRVKVRMSFRHLRRPPDPQIQAIDLGRGTFVVAPASASLDDLELSTAFPNDSSRVMEAVRRAMHRHARPVVSMTEIRGEVHRDPLLHLVRRTRGVHGTLDSLARVQVVREGGATRLHIQGRIRNVAYFSARRSAASKAWFGYLAAQAEWKETRVEERLSAMMKCVLPDVARAHADVLHHELARFRATFDELAAEDCFPAEVEEKIELRRTRIDVASDFASAWQEESHGGDENAGVADRWDAPHITFVEAEELAQASVPRKRFAYAIRGILARKIRRIFDPARAAEGQTTGGRRRVVVYDRFDLRVHLAQQWGGTECYQHARDAQEELNQLRDWRPVLRSLDTGSLDERLVAVSCLAFLCTAADTEVVDRLAQLTLEDPEAGVRQSALWAYGFLLGAEPSLPLAYRVADTDPVAYVREFAAEAISTLQEEGRGWWAV